MLQDKDISQMTAAELRTALAEYTRSQQPAPAPVPLPPGITTDMSPKAQDAASTLYAEAIMRKPAGSWTPEEREFMRGSITDTLKNMGY